MTDIKRTVIFGKLNRIGYKSLENATLFCKMRSNPYVEVVHWIHQIIQHTDCDFMQILKQFDINEARLVSDITAALDKLPRGATSLSDLSAHLDDVMERAWTYATLMFSESQIRTGHLLVAMLKTRHLTHILKNISSEFSKINPESLTDSFHVMVKASVENQMTSTDGSTISAGTGTGEQDDPVTSGFKGRQKALDQYSVDLTEKARNNEMDPILGREKEIRKIEDILMRRRQNNPILTGEAGVGKTAVVEGFAQKIVLGDVPPMLKDVRLVMLDIGLLQAGASVKGEFENRLRQVIEEVQSSSQPIILFIDEAHTLIGAGGSTGTGDAANLLKPALARGTLRTIAATTWSEYKKYIEKDPALTRRFQVVKVEEPDEESAVKMLRGLSATLEKHHQVMILDQALEAAVKLSSRYIAGRQLPDKAISLLDTACARVAISQHDVPAHVEAGRKRIADLTTEIDIIQREITIGMHHEKRLADVEEKRSHETEQLQHLEERWHREKEVVARILDIRQQLRQTSSPIDSSENDLDEPSRPDADTASVTVPAIDDDGQRSGLLSELNLLNDQLQDMQADTPLIMNSVDADAVGSVVADWTGIPVGRMVKDDVSSVLNLSDTLEKRVIGQRHGLDALTRRIQTSRAGVDNPNRPVGVFLLAGPSGVGKTETALALAEAMYGGEHNLITINMSEFQESHTVSTLKGAPPGYVGYGEGGVLTEAVRRHPYSVILLDEVEKAHPDVHEIFFQVFDKGRMEDGEGRMIDFKNTIILLTSNVGSEHIMHMCSNPETRPDPDTISEALRPPLLQVFPAALLGRLTVIPYYPISSEVLDLIIRLQLDRIQKRLRENRKIAFTYDESVVSLIADRCRELESGARVVDSILTNTLLPEISHAYLTGIVDGEKISTVHACVEYNDFTYNIN